MNKSPQHGEYLGRGFFSSPSSSLLCLHHLKSHRSPQQRIAKGRSRDKSPSFQKQKRETSLVVAECVSDGWIGEEAEGFPKKQKRKEVEKRMLGGGLA